MYFVQVELEAKKKNENDERKNMLSFLNSSWCLYGFETFFSFPLTCSAVFLFNILWFGLIDIKLFGVFIYLLYFLDIRIQEFCTFQKVMSIISHQLFIICFDHYQKNSVCLFVFSFFLRFSYYKKNDKTSNEINYWNGQFLIGVACYLNSTLFSSKHWNHAKFIYGNIHFYQQY